MHAICACERMQCVMSAEIRDVDLVSVDNESIHSECCYIDVAFSLTLIT